MSDPLNQPASAGASNGPNVTDTNSEALAQARIDIARLEVQVTHLSASMATLEESNQQLTAKLDQVLLTLSEARGGWKTLMAVGGAASAAGGVATWVAQHFFKG